MLGDEYIVIAVILRLAAGLGYLMATRRGIVQPNPVSWLFWGLTPLVAFAAQVQDGVTPQAWVTLTLGTSPLLVFVLSVAGKSHWRVGRFDVLCGGSAAAGVVLWQITSDPVLALLFSALADLLASIPTLIKAYDAPTSERASPYFVSLVSMTVTLLTISDWKFMEYAFPLYMLLINTTIFGVVRMRSTQFGRRPYEEVVSLPRRPAAVPWQPHPAREYPLVIARPSSNLFRSGVSPAHWTSSRRSQASAADHTAAHSHYIADADGTEIELYSDVRVGRLRAGSPGHDCSAQRHATSAGRLHRARPCRRK